MMKVFLSLWYNFADSMTPGIGADLAPRIEGYIQMRPLAGSSTQMEISGIRADFPNIEVIRDYQTSSGYASTVLLQYQHESGGVTNLYECCADYMIAG
jgi:hypothetical protein